MSEKFADAVYKWRGIDHWPEAKATVYSCEWVPGGRNTPAYYVVTFSYEAQGELRSGSYREDGSEDSQPYSRGDSFDIRWNPANPNKTHTSMNSFNMTFNWIILIIVLTFVLLVIVFH